MNHKKTSMINDESERKALIYVYNNERYNDAYRLKNTKLMGSDNAKGQHP